MVLLDELSVLTDQLPGFPVRLLDELPVLTAGLLDELLVLTDQLPVLRSDSSIRSRILMMPTC